MIKSEDVTIGKNKYTVVQFGGMKALKIQVKLTKLIGPTLGALMTSGELNLADIESVMNSDIDGDTIAKAMSSFVDQLDGDKTSELIMELLSETSVNGRQMDDAVFNDTFVGNFRDMYILIGHIIRINYASVFAQGVTGSLSA